MSTNYTIIDRVELQVERVQKAGGLYANFASDQSLSYLNGSLPGGKDYDGALLISLQRHLIIIVSLQIPRNILYFHPCYFPCTI